MRRGFTLLEVMIVVMVIGILLTIAIPSYINARQTSRTTVCVRNLAKLDMAKEQWAMATHQAQGAVCQLSDIVPDYLKNAPVCLSGGTYTVGTVGSDPTCSIGGDHSL